MPEWTIPYVPHDGQLPFHRDRYKIKYRLASAGTGSGKTTAGLFEIVSWLLENQGAVGYSFEPTIPMVRRILLPGLERLLGSPLGKSPLVEDFRETDKRLDLVGGSRYWFGSLEDPEMAEGPNVDIIHIDEARLVRDFGTSWKVAQRRIRGSVPGKFPTGAFVTTTPDAPGSEIFKFFEDPKTRDPEAKVYRWTLDDNKANLPPGYIESIKRSHTGGLFERFVLGRFAAVGSVSFEYDSTRHELAVPRDKIVDVAYGADFGWTNPSCLLAVGFDGDDRAYILREFYQPRTKTEVLITELKLMMEEYGQGPVYCDRSEPRTIDDFRLAGIDAKADESKREDGIRDLGGRFKDAGDGRPRIYVDPSCVNWVAEVLAYNADKKENDHAVDTTRYALMNHVRGQIMVSTARRP